MAWEITDIKKLDKNTLKGSFTLVIGPLHIEGFTCHENNGKRWIGFPAKEYFDSDGKKKYWPLLRVPDKGRYANFQRWAKAQVGEELFAPAAPDPEPEIEPDDIPF